MANWFYAVLIFMMAGSLWIYFQSLIIPFIMLNFFVIFFPTLLPNGVQVMIGVVDFLAVGRIFYNIFAARKAE
jgi:hypothetical protein